MNRKLVVFVPPAALDAVRDAVFSAGAGRIGAYKLGEEEHVEELRLETVFPEERQGDVVEALRRAHPYEEPAFDIYALL